MAQVCSLSLGLQLPTPPPGPLLSSSSATNPLTLSRCTSSAGLGPVARVWESLGDAGGREGRCRGLVSQQGIWHLNQQWDWEGGRDPTLYAKGETEAE